MKIELTNVEIEIIKAQLAGEIGMFTATDEQRAVMMGVIDKANALCEELDAYDEMGDDLIAWFWNKYQDQCQ